MKDKKKAPAKKPMSLRERMANRHKQIDQASGFGSSPKKPAAKKGADRKTPVPKKYQ